MKCMFCERTSEGLIHETSYWRVVLAFEQSYLGRCLVVLKRHCGDLAELRPEEWSDFAELVKKLESALRKAFGATMFNWTCLMNNAYQHDPPNPHVHWHFRPRYDHEVKFAGVVFRDPGFGHHYDRMRVQRVSEDVKRKIIEEIKQNLD